MRENCVVYAVTLMLTRKLVNSSTAKNNFIGGFFVVKSVVLPLNLNFSLFEFLDNFLDRVLEEAFKREDLLGDETILLEVAVNNLPAIILVDGVHVGPNWCIVTLIHFQQVYALII